MRILLLLLFTCTACCVTAQKYSYTVKGKTFDIAFAQDGSTKEWNIILSDGGKNPQQLTLDSFFKADDFIAAIQLKQEKIQPGLSENTYSETVDILRSIYVKFWQRQLLKQQAEARRIEREKEKERLKPKEEPATIVNEPAPLENKSFSSQLITDTSTFLVMINKNYNTLSLDVCQLEVNINLRSPDDCNFIIIYPAISSADFVIQFKKILKAYYTKKWNTWKAPKGLDQKIAAIYTQWQKDKPKVK